MADEEGICGNFGLHDQLYFFRWLQRNVGRFGGDPDRITVMGNSAGAFSIAALMACYRHDPSEKLFSNAIFESGAPCTMSFRSKDSYFPYYDQLLKRAGVSTDSPLQDRLQALRNLSSEDLMKFEGEYFPFGNYGCTQETGSHAVFDEHPFDRLSRGDWDPHVKCVMIGCVEHEASLSGGPLKVGPVDLQREQYLKSLIFLSIQINTPEGHLANIDRFPEGLRDSLKALYPVNTETEATTVAPGNRLLAHHIFTGPAYQYVSPLTGRFTRRASRITCNCFTVWLSYSQMSPMRIQRRFCRLMCSVLTRSIPIPTLERNGEFSIHLSLPSSSTPIRCGR